MKRCAAWLAAVSFAACCIGAQAQPSQSSPAALAVPAGYALVWSDEFTEPGAPDPAKWSYDTGRNKAGWYNHELQYYSRDRAENAEQRNGRLVITARHETLDSAADRGRQRYTSARLLTRGKAEWTYGFFEIRARLACGKGTWPAENSTSWNTSAINPGVSSARCTRPPAAAPMAPARQCNCPTFAPGFMTTRCTGRGRASASASTV